MATVGDRGEQLGPDEHRAEPTDEKEREDHHQVLESDDLVVRGHPEVLAQSSILAVHVGVVLLGRALCAEEAADRIVEEAHARKETDDAEGIPEEDSWIGTEGVVLTKRVRDSVRADCEADDESDHGADDSQW